MESVTLSLEHLNFHELTLSDSKQHVHLYKHLQCASMFQCDILTGPMSKIKTLRFQAIFDMQEAGLSRGQERSFMGGLFLVRPPDSLP